VAGVQVRVNPPDVTSDIVKVVPGDGQAGAAISFSVMVVILGPSVVQLLSVGSPDSTLNVYEVLGVNPVA